uniref:Disease resistance N-terminal domain-containing protein n=1 Tax=Fagus sylvatica TaxID=28930 RepID=A0A2N9F528_FAGSY
MILDLIKSEKVRPRSTSLKHASKLEIRDQLLCVGQRGEEGEGGFVFVSEEGEAEQLLCTLTRSPLSIFFSQCNMAAKTFVFNIADKLLGKLNSLTYQVACLVWGVESDLEGLEKTLSVIKAVLLDAEEQQFHNQELTVWLGNLREVFYDAQDVLDEFECEALQRQDVETRGSTTRKVCYFFSSSNSLVFRTKMGHQIKEIRDRLEEVAAYRAKFHLSERLENRHVVRGREMSHSFVHASDVIGRDQDKENILQLLMHPVDGDQNVSVISVVGIGGLGKTALAKLDIEKWIELRTLLMGVAFGSKILVTTRSPIVASMMATVSSYNLEGLPHEECLFLFVKCAFDEGQESQHANLVEIGNEMVKKCKGVPLAMKSLGSLLYSKLDERDWLFGKR